MSITISALVPMIGLCPRAASVHDNGGHDPSTDVGIAVLRADGETVALLAATDSD